MLNQIEFVLKLKDLLSGGMAKAAASTQASFHGVDNTILQTQKKLAAISKPAKLAVDISALRTAHTELDKLQQKLTRGGGPGGGIMGSVIGGNLVAGAIAGTASMAKDLIGDSIKYAMQAGKNKASFQVMAGNKSGNQLYDNLTGFARDSIYGNEVYQNAQTMLGFGIGVDKVMPNMKMLGDIAMGDAQKLGSLTLAFSQVQAAGKLQGQDLLQLINAGFNPLGIIAEKTGQSMDKLKDQMSAGKISFKLVEDAFKSATSEGGRFYNMTNKIAETPYGKAQALQGQIEGVKTDLGNMFLPYASSLMDITSKSLEWLDIHKSIPKSLSYERSEVDTLVRSILSLNDKNSVRAAMLEKLKDKYPDVLGNLDIEKLKNGELLGILGNVNAAYERRIGLAQMDYNMTGNSKAISEAIDLQIKVRNAMAANKADKWAGLGVIDSWNLGNAVPGWGSQVYNPNTQQSLSVADKLLADKIQRLTKTNAGLSALRPKEEVFGLINAAQDVATGKTAIPSWWGKSTGKNMAELMKERMDLKNHFGDAKWLREHGTGRISALLAPTQSDLSKLNSVMGSGGSLVGGDGSDSSSRAVASGSRRAIIININKEMISEVTINSKTTAGGINELEPKLQEMLLRVLLTV